MRIIPRDEVKEHKTAESCWVIRKNKVYDVTHFINNHPGGAQSIVDFSGEDVTLLMNTRDSHIHSRNAYNTLSDMQIGVVEGHENDLGADDEHEPLDFSKPMLDQVGQLGRKYSKWVHEPVDRWVRLFKNDTVEILSKSPWYLVPITWLPVICYNLLQGYHMLSANPKIEVFATELNFGVWLLPVVFALGLLSWPFIEYFLHRFIFHQEPNGDQQWLIRLHFSMHGLHHKAPFDPYHLVFPPLPAAIIAVVVYSTYYVLLAENMVNGWFAGTVLGYIFYDLTHYYIHHGHPEPDTYFGRLKKWHIRHHYIDPDNGFGVSSNVLDFPFGTDFPNYKYKK